MCMRPDCRHSGLTVLCARPPAAVLRAREEIRDLLRGLFDVQDIAVVQARCGACRFRLSFLFS